MSRVSFDYIRDMPTIRIVVTENCELCDKGLKSLGYLKNLFTIQKVDVEDCLLYTSPSPRDPKTSRMPSSA